MRKLVRLFLVFALAALALPGAVSAQESDSDRDRGRFRPTDTDGLPFVFQGIEWQSQRAFVESGARCSTRNVDEEEQLAIEAEVARLLADKGGETCWRREA